MSPRVVFSYRCCGSRSNLCDDIRSYQSVLFRWYPISAVVSGTGLTNFEIGYVASSYTITKAPTNIIPDSNIDGINNDCTNSTYTATLTDAVTGQDLGGISLKMTVGASRRPRRRILLNWPPSP